MGQIIEARRKIIPALDDMTLFQALGMIDRLHKQVPAFKAHDVVEENMAFTVGEFRRQGAEGVWLDYKDHDTPDTVGRRAIKAKNAGATMLTVHAHGGPKMLEEAIKYGPEHIIVVTLLTSLTDKLIQDLYRQPKEQVIETLADWALQGGAKLLVCSPTQVGTLASISRFRKAFQFIVPGTRSAGQATHDQQQVDTPYNAVLNGADFLVGGRQITKAEHPDRALGAMAEEIAPAFAQRGQTATA